VTQRDQNTHTHVTTATGSNGSRRFFLLVNKHNPLLSSVESESSFSSSSSLAILYRPTTMATAMLSPQPHPFEDVERSYSEADQSSQDLSEDSWRQLACVTSLPAQSTTPSRSITLLTRRRKIVRDVGPTLSPDEELGDLAAAEAAVHARDEERGKDLDELQRELQGVLEFTSLILVLLSLVSQTSSALRLGAPLVADIGHREDSLGYPKPHRTRVAL
jgi:hypothetical protein